MPSFVVTRRWPTGLTLIEPERRDGRRGVLRCGVGAIQVGENAISPNAVNETVDFAALAGAPAYRPLHVPWSLHGSMWPA
jgi:hypothetical protein